MLLLVDAAKRAKKLSHNVGYLLFRPLQLLRMERRGQRAVNFFEHEEESVVGVDFLDEGDHSLSPTIRQALALKGGLHLNAEVMTACSILPLGARDDESGFCRDTLNGIFLAVRLLLGGEDDGSRAARDREDEEVEGEEGGRGRRCRGRVVARFGMKRRCRS